MADDVTSSNFWTDPVLRESSEIFALNDIADAIRELTAAVNRISSPKEQDNA